MAAAAQGEWSDQRTSLWTSGGGGAREPAAKNRVRRRQDQLQDSGRETVVRVHRRFRQCGANVAGTLAVATGGAAVAERRDVAIDGHPAGARTFGGNLGALAARANYVALGPGFARRFVPAAARAGLR